MAQSAEDAQTRKVEGDLSKVNTALQRAKQECENSEAQLSDMQAKNESVQNENDWENKIKALQNTLSEKEQLTQTTQAQADQVMAQMGSKLNVFKDPFMDRASETEDLMAKIRDINGDDDSPGQRIPGSAGSFGAKRTGDGGTDFSSPLGKGSAGRGSDLSPTSFGVDGRGRRTGDSNLSKGAGGRKDRLGDLMRINDDLKSKAEHLND